jgi:hypothetical protein
LAWTDPAKLETPVWYEEILLAASGATLTELTLSTIPFVEPLHGVFVGTDNPVMLIVGFMAGESSISNAGCAELEESIHAVIPVKVAFCTLCNSTSGVDVSVLLPSMYVP